MARMSRVVRAVTFTLVLLAVGCGGGGGGGDADGTDVYVERFTPSSIAASRFYDANATYTARITVYLGGPLEVLEGKTLHTHVTSTDDLFTSAEVEDVDVWEATAHVRVRTENVLAPGRYRGTLRITGCLDAQCHTKLGNTPLDVDYDFTILADLSLGQDTLSRTVLFGTRPAAVRVPVNLPQGATTWDLVRDDETSGTGVVASKASDGSANVDIEFHLRTSGVTETLYFVRVEAPDPAGGARPVQFSRPLDVKYAVTSTGQPVAMVPASSSLEIEYGDQDTTFDSFEWVIDQALDPVCEAASRVVDAMPAEAIGNPMTNYDQWYMETMITTCGFFSDHWECLPAGTYRARTVQTCSVGTRAFTAEHALDLVITPAE